MCVHIIEIDLDNPTLCHVKFISNWTSNRSSPILHFLRCSLHQARDYLTQIYLEHKPSYCIFGRSSNLFTVVSALTEVLLYFRLCTEVKKLNDQKSTSTPLSCYLTRFQVDKIEHKFA